MVKEAFALFAHNLPIIGGSNKSFDNRINPNGIDGKWQSSFGSKEGRQKAFSVLKAICPGTSHTLSCISAVGIWKKGYAHQ